MLEKLSQYSYFQYFQEICAVPRGSGNNEAISAYLVDFAKKHNLYVHQDSACNVIMRKEAAPGFEHLPGIILQGHMDMVCEKESDCCHDFTKEGLELAIDGDYLYAKGTTLGGDDGIALAYALAILSDSNAAYPMIEFVATTDEETGMYGAKAIDTSLLKGKYMINLDTEEEGSLLVGCAGGLRGEIRLPLAFEKRVGKVYQLGIHGLQGGHSGCEIDKNRVNATLLLGRLLLELETSYYLVQMEGGTKDNAIPREAQAVILVSSEDALRFEQEVKDRVSGYQAEYLGFEPDLAYTLSSCADGEGEAMVMTKACQEKIVFLLNTAPDGVQEMSSEIPGLVESSLNMGIFEAKEEMKACYSIRSSRAGYKEYVSEKLKKFAQYLGGSYEEGERYPAWIYKKDSVLRDKMIKVYREFYHKEPVVEVIHAGLECGILCEKSPELDIVAIGPDILDIHTPKERLSISSTVRVFDYLLKVLQELSEA